MVAINPHTTRATGTVLTAAIYNADHQNHITNANNLNAGLGTAQADILVLDNRIDANDVILAFLQNKPTMQQFDVAGAATWNRPANCKRIIVEGVGGGGGSGGCSIGAVGNAGMTGGGAGGFYAKTSPLDVTATATAAIVIGAAGAAAAAGNNPGGNGGDTTMTVGATTYTWKGGSGSFGYVPNAARGAASEGGLGLYGINLVGYAEHGTMGVCEATAGAGQSTGGNGGSTPFGMGGLGAHTSAAAVEVGVAGSGFGAGGGGSCSNNIAATVGGAAGTRGMIRVWEFY